MTFTKTQEATMPLRRPTGFGRTTPARLAALAPAFALAACLPEVPHTDPAVSVVTAVFDPNTAQLPQPNDLALQQVAATLGLSPAVAGAALHVPAAQAELLQEFVKAGGFPNDQEVAVTIDFARVPVKVPDNAILAAAPDLDLSSFKWGSTLIVYGSNAGGSGPVEIDPILPGDYVKGATKGTLTIHNKGRKPWPAGRYMVLVRGGPNGVKTATGESIWASQTFYLIAQGLDLTTPDNFGLIGAQVGTPGIPDLAAAQKAAGDLTAIINSYKSGGVFAVADSAFPHQELAVLATFAIAPGHTQVDLDPARSKLPVPIDLMRFPDTATTIGKITPEAACSLAAGTYDSAAKTCSSAASGGFQALDGFGTTAPLLAPTNGLVLTSTINPGTVFLFELPPLGSTAAPKLVPPSSLIFGPCDFASGPSASSSLSPAIALQPAGATACDPTSVFRTRPLKDATTYAVVITTGVLDKAGNPIAAGTVAKLLKLASPIVATTPESPTVPVSTLAPLGVNDEQGVGLEAMRQRLQPVLDVALPGIGKTRADVAMAYTFRTQTILAQAAQLAAIPYLRASSTPALALPISFTTSTAAAAFAKYGVDPDLVPLSNIAEIIEAKISGYSALDPATGAFLHDPSLAPTEPRDVLIAVPKLTAAPPLVAPLMIFRHGIGGGRADMLPLADTYAAKGMVTVAIDAAKHGARSYCTSGSATTTLSGHDFPNCLSGTCQAILPVGAQVDDHPLGLCFNADHTPGLPFKRPVSASCLTNPDCGWSPAAGGIEVYSSNYLVTKNFFRSRDTLRHDILDQSQLVLAIAVDPTNAAATAHHAVYQELLKHGVVIDASRVYYTGQSLGSVQGAANVAANPRISKAVFNVGGGTIVDIFTTSPSFGPGTASLLASLSVVPGTESYLQFLLVAKTILDPAEPLNFVGHLTTSTLPNLLPPLGGAIDGSVAQQPKKIFSQNAFCDQVVPNPWNILFAATAGVTPLPNPLDPTYGTIPGNEQLFYTGTTAPTQADLLSCPSPKGTVEPSLPAGAVDHGFLITWTRPFTSPFSQTGQAQLAAANFVMADQLPTHPLTVLP